MGCVARAWSPTAHAEVAGQAIPCHAALVPLDACSARSGSAWTQQLQLPFALQLPPQQRCQQLWPLQRPLPLT